MMPRKKKTGNTNKIPSIEYFIQNSSATMQCLAVQRRLAEIKQKRERANRRFDKIRTHHEKRVATASSKLRKLLFGQKMLPIYADALRSQFTISLVPTNYVLLKLAELLKYARHNDLLETYVDILKQHNDESICAVENTQMNLSIGLQMQERRISSLQDNLIGIVAENILSFHNKSEKDLHGSISSLTSLIERRRSVAEET